MVRKLLISVLFTSSLFSQTTSSATKTPPSKAAPTAKTQSATPTHGAKPDQKATADPAEQTVITVHGLCDKSDKAGAINSDKCFTAVGREEFDKVTEAVTKPDQQLAPAAKRALAEKYVELLVLANAAKEAGVDQSPEFAASLYLLQLRTLAEFYQRQLELEYRNPPQAEIDAYYKEHAGDYVSSNVSRVYVPKNDPSGKATTPEQKSAFAAKASQVADEMLARASKGEGLEKLQKEAYEKLSITSTPPSTTIGAMRKGSLPAADDKQMFALEPGAVFKSDAAGAFTIYKVDSKQNLTEENVKDEIARVIFRQKMEKKVKELNASVKSDLDDKYFGPAPSPAAQPVSPK
jgi:hypothetical protein